MSHSNGNTHLSVLAGTFKFRLQADKQFTLLDIGNEVETITGFSAEYFLGSQDTWYHRVHPDDRESVLFGTKQVFEQGYWVQEYRFLHRENRYIRLREEMKFEQGQSGPTRIITGRIFDLSSRKQAERQAQQRTDVIQVIENQPNVVFQIDPQGHWSYLSHQWESLTGQPVPHALGQSIYANIHPDDRPKVREHIDPLLRRSQQEGRVHFRICGEDGYRKAELFASLHFGSRSCFLGLAGTLVDHSQYPSDADHLVAQNHRLEQELNKHNEQLEKLNHELQEEILRRRESEILLLRRLEQQRTIAQCSKNLLGQSGVHSLKKALTSVMQGLHADRVIYYRREEHGGRLQFTAERSVSQEGIKSIEELPIDEPSFPWIFKTVTQGGHVASTTDRIPDPDRRLLEEHHIRSLLIIPVYDAGKRCGCLSVHRMFEDNAWQEEEINLLQTVSELVGSFITHRSREQYLVFREQFFAKVLDCLPGLVYVMDTNLDFITWNSRVEEVTGYSDEEIGRMSPLDFFTAQGQEAVREKIETVFKQGSDTLNVNVLTRDGSQIPYFFNSVQYKDQYHEYLIGIGIDRSELKQARVELRYEKKLMDSLINALPGIFYLIDEEGNYLRWNKNLETEFGYSAKEIEAMNPLDFYDEPYRSEIAGKILEVVKNGTASIETKVRNRYGEHIPYFLNASSFKTDDKSFLAGIGYNMSAQYQTRHELRRRERFFSQLFEGSPIAIALLDTDNAILRVNQSFTDLFGYDESALNGEDIEALLVPDRLKQTRPKAPLTAYSHFAFQFETVRQAADGREVPVFFAGIPVQLDDEAIGAFGIFIDLSEHKRYEEELRASLNENRVLLQEIHHRVKNNLAIISGLLQLQQFNAVDTELAQALRDSEMRIHTIALVHEQLYHSESLSSIRFKPYLEQLSRIIADKYSTHSDSVRTQLELDDAVLNVNQAIPCALMISEATSNAYKHAFVGRESGTVHIKLNEQGEDLHIMIHDNGSGISPDVLHSVMENKKNPYMGLCVIHTLVKQLDGELKIKSDERGTRYDIHFRRDDQSRGSSAHFL